MDASIVVFNRFEERVADLNLDSISGWHEVEDGEGELSFSFSYNADEPDASYLVQRNYIAIPDPEDQSNTNWLVYVIDKPTVKEDGFITVNCTHRMNEIQGAPVTTWTFQSNPTLMMAETLKDTRFKVGQVDFVNILKRGVDNMNPLKALNYIAEEFGGELRFRVTMRGSTFGDFYVDLLSRRGANNGVRFDLGHNLEQFEVSIDSRNVKTAFIGRGKGDGTGNQESIPQDQFFSFTDHVWSTANGKPVNKPAGRNYVSRDELLPLYGIPDGAGGFKHNFGFYDSPESKTPETLLQETWEQLLKNSNPITNIRASKAELGEIDPAYAHEKTNFGDDVIITADFNGYSFQYTARIIRVERNRLAPDQTTVEIGDYAPTGSSAENKFRQQQYETMQKVENIGQIFEDGKIPVDFIVGDFIDKELGDTQGFVYADEGGLLILDKPKDQNPTKAMRLGGGVFALSNAKDAQGNWIWRNFGDGSGFTMDELKANTIRTNKFKIEGDAYFYWDMTNLYVIDPADLKKQIRIGKYDGTKYGIGYTTDGGATFSTVLDHQGLRVGAKTVFESGYDPKQVAADAKAYSDSQKQTIDNSIATVQQNVDNLDTYVDDVFRYDVIDTVEARDLNTQLKQLAQVKGNIDNQYTSIYANADLAGTPKTNLQTAKTNTDTAYTNLINSINTAVLDGKTTVAEKNDVLAKYDLFNTNLKTFMTRYEEAVNEIARKKAADAQSAATAAAKSYTDGIKTATDTAIQGVRDSVTNLNTYVDGAFEDGIIAQAEAKAIEKYLNSLVATKKEVDARYTEVYNNANLLGTPKSDLSAKNTTFGTSYTALINSINTAISDGKTTTAEKTDVDTKYATFQTDLSNLLKAFDTAAAAIGQQMANSGSQAAKDYADGLKTDIDISINAVSKSVTDLNTYVDGAFEDSVISQSEAKAIEKYLNLINGDKADLDARYNDVYANGNLTGTPKTDLASKKTAYNTAHTNLTNSINTAIADGKTTAAEKTDVDSKYTAYRTAVSNLSTSFENAVDAIAIKLAGNAQTAAQSYADGLKTATDTAIQGVRDSVTTLNTYVDGSFKDGVIQQAEAIAIGKYINTLNANKMDYDKSYSEVYNNASLPTGTVKTDLAAKKTAFDTAHTNLVNSINTAIADGKTTAAEKTDVDTKFTAYNTAISNLRVAIEAGTSLIAQTMVNTVKPATRNLLLKSGSVVLNSTNPTTSGYPSIDFTMSPTALTTLRNNEMLISLVFTGKITAWGTTNKWLGVEVAVTYADTSQAWLSLRLDTASSGFVLNKDYVREPFVVTQKLADKAITSLRAYTLSRDNTGTAKIEECFVGLGNTYVGWSPAPEDDVNALSDLQNYINTDFHDDIISKAEADNIEKMLYEIDTRKNDTEQNYQRTYTNGFLKTAAIKTALSTAKTNFDAAHNALRTSITNAIADGKLTAAEKTDIDSKFTTYKTRVSEMSTAYNNALDDIMAGRQAQAAADSKTYADTNFQRSMYQQPDPPAAPKLYDIWIETDVFPNVWYAWRGQGWVRSIVNDLSSMVGKIGSTQITDGAVLSPAIGANQVVAAHIKAGAVTVDKLDVTALNFVDNFSQTGDIHSHWRYTSTPSGTTNSATMSTMPAGSGLPSTLKCLALTTNGNAMYETDMIPVSPNQDYKTRLTFYKPQSHNQMYFGVYAYDINGVAIAIESFTLSSRGFTSGTTNEYFMNTYATGTQHVEAYIAASYRREDEMPTGRGVSAHLRMKPETAYIKLRILNFYSTAGVSTVYFANPTFQLADSGKLSFDNFQGGTGTLGGANNGDGRLIMKDGSGNQKGKWDKDGMYLNGGSLTIERPDGVQWMANGMQKWNFAVNPHEPMFIGTSVSINGCWWQTKTGIDRDAQVCNFYSYQRSGRYLKLELSYFAQFPNTDNAIVIIDRSGTQILIQEGFGHTDSKYSKTFTLDLGTPDYGVGAIYLCLYTWSGQMCYLRNIRMWIEG